jgi:hypothetical protein
MSSLHFYQHRPVAAQRTSLPPSLCLHVQTTLVRSNGLTLIMPLCGPLLSSLVVQMAATGRGAPGVPGAGVAAAGAQAACLACPGCPACPWAALAAPTACALA